MRYLLDTNTLIYIINARPKHQRVLDRFAAEEARGVVVSSISLAELRYGIAKSEKRETSRDALERIIAALTIINFDAGAAERYGELRAALEIKGKTIGPLDALIAAHALSLNLILVTNNTREFARVRGLKIENWLTN